MGELGTDTWVRVAAVAALKEDAPLAVDINGDSIGVFLVNGKIYAVENVCPHAYALLSQGFVEGEMVECPLHAAVFNLNTGKCLGGPTDRDIKTYDVKVEGGDILVQSSPRS